jgi:hypothetical protein
MTENEERERLRYLQLKAKAAEASAQTPVAAEPTAPTLTPGQEAAARNSAALRGAGQGFTFGQSANIGGLIQALGERVLPDKNPTVFGLELPFGGGDSTRHGSFAEAFERNKGTTQRENDASWDEHPWLYGGGNALATLATLFLPLGAAGRATGATAQAPGIGARLASKAPQLTDLAPVLAQAGQRAGIPNAATLGQLLKRGATSGLYVGGATGAGNGLGDLLRGNYAGFAGDVAMGAGMGGLLGGALAPIPGLVGSLGPRLENFAYRRAVKAAGPMLKDVRALFTTGRLESVGKKLMDMGLIRRGAGIEEIAGAVENAANARGTNVHSILGELDALQAPAAEGIASEVAPAIRHLELPEPKASTIRDLALPDPAAPSGLMRLPPTLQVREPMRGVPEAPASGDLPGFNPAQVAERLRTELLDPLRDQPALQSLIPGLEREIRNLEALGDRRLTFQRANDIKRGYDKFLNWTKEQTPAKELLKEVRRIVNNEIETTADAAATAVGDPDLIGRFRSAKLDYRDLRQVADFAQDQVARREANRFVSPSDYGVGIGSAAAAVASGHPAMGALMGVAGAAGNKLLRERGNSFAANTALNLSQRLAIPGNLADLGLRGLTSGVARYRGQKGLYDLLDGATLFPRSLEPARMVAP